MQSYQKRRHLCLGSTRCPLLTLTKCVYPINNGGTLLYLSWFFTCCATNLHQSEISIIFINQSQLSWPQYWTSGPIRDEYYSHVTNPSSPHGVDCLLEMRLLLQLPRVTEAAVISGYGKIFIGAKNIF